MKNKPMVTVLLGLLTLSVLGSVILCWLYISSVRELRSLQTQVGMINNNRAVMNALANETVEYSKKNKEIDPILQSVGLKPGKTNLAPATQPATK